MRESVPALYTTISMTVGLTHPLLEITQRGPFGYWGKKPSSGTSSRRYLVKQIMLTRAKNTPEAPTRASEIAHLDRPFTGGDFIEEWLMVTSEEMCLKRLFAFQGLSLLRMTVQRSVHDAANGLSKQLEKSCDQLVYYTLVLARSTDIEETAILPSFIRGTDENLEVIQKLPELCSMHGQATGEQISKRAKNHKKIGLVGVSLKLLAKYYIAHLTGQTKARDKCCGMFSFRKTDFDY